MKSFSDACHLVGPLRLAVESVGEPDAGVRVLNQPFALVGRDPRADVPLEHRLISRRHAYIQVVEGHAFWIDLESRLGTEAGGRPRKHGWLTRDEPLRIGPYELRLAGSSESRPPSSTPLVSRSYGAGSWPEVGLEFLNGPSRAAVWPMNRVVSLIGSAAGCKFRLSDPSVSLFHCSLVRTEIGLWVVDLLGGVEVNNATVRVALLADGDILGVGRYRIRIRNRDVPGDSRSLTLARVAPSGGDLLPIGRDDPNAARGIAVPTVSILPAEIAGAATDPVAVLVPLMNQFGLMQQQMMDQFQNAMGMLVEMFGSLQREQMDLIRQELDQLREVTREVQELKSELASISRERDGQAEPNAAASEAATAKVAPTAPAAETIAGVRIAPATTLPPIDPSPARPSSAPPPRAEAPAEAARPGARPRPPRPERPAPGANDADVMLWLNQRIGTLQEERESRWRKILKLLPGSS